MKKTIAILLSVLFVTLLLFYPKVHVSRASTGGFLFWNSDSALLFMSRDESGAVMSYTRWAADPIVVGWLGHVRSPSDQRCKTTVIVVTVSEVNQNDTKLNCVAGYHVFRGEIYAVNWPGLWRWSGGKFEPSSAATMQAFKEERFRNELGPHPWQFDNVEGWSMRQLGLTGPRYDIPINGQPLTIIFHGPTWPPQPVSVELVRMGQPPQTIWSVDESPRRVSKPEYERIFSPN